MIDERRLTHAEISEDLAHIEDALRGVAKARAEMGTAFDANVDLADPASLLAQHQRVGTLIVTCLDQASALRHRKTDIILADDAGLSGRWLDAVDRAQALRADLNTFVATQGGRIFWARQVVAGRA